MTQLDLLERPAYTRARRTNPDTSHQAAARVAEFAAQHHEKILEALRTHGSQTVHEIAARCNLEPHSVGKRMSELERAGRAEVVIVGASDSPEGCAVLTRPSPTGRPARVWKAT